MEPAQLPVTTKREGTAFEDATPSDWRGIPQAGSHHGTVGHSFNAVTTQDSARVHMGDVHGGQHNHYHAAPAPDSGVEEMSLLEALSFEQMDFRSSTIAPAYARTCDWLFSASPYKRWRNADLVSEHNGFLWIKGKPGAGKSTVMKHAWEHAQFAFEDETTVSFFFNARGIALGKSIEGMYRCLLHQMIGQIPHLSSKVSAADRCAYRSEGWPVAILEDLFRHAVLHLCKKTKLSCYVDALDEGDDEDQVRNMVEFFYELAERAVSYNLPFYVCLASRYYPKISVTCFEELRLEHHKGHDDDISNYVHNKLRLANGLLKQQLSSEINRRSSGVFLWVVLVVSILNKEGDRGNHHLLLARLQEVPNGLLQLLKDLRSRDASDNRFIFAIQWVLYALRPLQCEELYVAVLASIGDLTAETAVQVRQIAHKETIENFITSSSKGLLEIVWREDTRSLSHGEFEDPVSFAIPRQILGSGKYLVRRGEVQFIHEVVREFFLGVSGFRAEMDVLDHTEAHSSGDPFLRVQGALANSEQAIVRGTMSFDSRISTDPVRDLGDSDSVAVDEAAATSHNRFSRICQDYIRVSYTTGLTRKVQSGTRNLAALSGKEHVPFLKYSLDMALGHADAASMNGLRVTNLTQEFPWDEWISCQSAKDQAYQRLSTWLQVMAYEGHSHLIKDELASISLKTKHSLPGREEFYSLLDSCSTGLGSALHIAASHSNIRSAKLLLDSGANVNNMCKDVGSPLHCAVSGTWQKARRVDTARLLLQHGADPNATDDRGNSSLHFAILSSNIRAVKALIASGADLHHRVGVLGDAVQTAGTLNSWVFMRKLADCGLDVDELDFGLYKDRDSVVRDFAVTRAPSLSDISDEEPYI